MGTDYGAAHEKAEVLCRQISSVVLGKDEVVRLVVVGMLSGGHVLIEDIPGVGKSSLGRALACSIDGAFQRIQFTPDLLPADIVGVSIYDRDAHEFSFKAGPLFANIVLADEINRTTPRTQSALLEAMNVGQVTVDGVTHVLPDPFMVIATQNPREFTGTFPLPESQMDRFLLRLSLDYPSREAEREVLCSRRLGDPIAQLAPALATAAIVELMGVVRTVTVSDPVMDYMQDLVGATRADKRLLLGASPRALLGLYRACQAHALVHGRGHVLPDDVKALAGPVLCHRLVSREYARGAGTDGSAQAILADLLEEVAIAV